tara:strand:- start:349 stop:600 length:252 start_codon:yes stop_codon:yes gene_type:complete
MASLHSLNVSRLFYIVYGTFFNLSNKNCSCIFRGFLKMTIASKYKNKKVLRLKIKIKQREFYKTLNPQAKPLGFNPQRRFRNQ